MRHCAASLLLLLTMLCAFHAGAQDTATLAHELITIKGGYAGKKKHLEEMRIRAYVPILLKAVGKGAAWNPGHPNWKDTEQRIAEDWRKHYHDHLTRMGRDARFEWIDAAMAREYAKIFTVEELAALLDFYRSPSGKTLLALEQEFLATYPAEMARSLARVMFGADTLSVREQEAFRSPENRERREFVVLFETEPVLHAEILRIGSKYVETQQPLVQQGALASAADAIDAMRRKLDTATRTELLAFLKSEVARKERILLIAAVAAATPDTEDAERTTKETAAFYKGLEQLSAQWRELAAR